MDDVLITGDSSHVNNFMSKTQHKFKLKTKGVASEYTGGVNRHTSRELDCTRKWEYWWQPTNISRIGWSPSPHPWRPAPMTNPFSKKVQLFQWIQYGNSVELKCFKVRSTVLTTSGCSGPNVAFAVCYPAQRGKDP